MIDNRFYRFKLIFGYRLRALAAMDNDWQYVDISFAPYIFEDKNSKMCLSTFQNGVVYIVNYKTTLVCDNASASECV